MVLATSTDVAALDAAIDGCEACRQAAFVARLEHGVTLPDGTPRYAFGAALGAGATGTVFEGFDHKLGRRVALKILAAGVGSGAWSEPRALASVVHPNVVGVHDVDELDGRRVLVMELVDGHTLKPGPFSTLWPLLLGAGRGLEAIHHAGLVHRDFKPTNVLVGRDGRARVSDFGLAVPSASTVGVAAGTAGYIAPEVLQGHGATAASDQYAFCVTFLQLATWPRWVERELRRGAAEAPSHRHASMGALLDALERTQRLRRRTALLAAAAALASAALALGVFSPKLPAPGCDDGWLDDDWSPEVRRDIAAQFAKVPEPWAAASARSVDLQLDAHVRRSKDVRRRACLQGRTEPNACLEAQRQTTLALLEPLRGGDPTTLREAALAVLTLPEPRRCEAPAASTPSEAPAEFTHALAESRARLLTLTATKRELDALDETNAHLAAARLLGPTSALVESMLLVGRIRARAALTDSVAAAALSLDADARFTEAAVLAERLGDDALRAEAWVELASSQDAAASARAAPFAEAAVARLPPGSFTEVRWLRLSGQRALAAGDARRALELATASVSLSAKTYGDDDLRTAECLRSRAVVLRGLKRVDEARADAQRALQLAEAYLGPEHPELGNTLRILGGIEVMRGDWPLAEQHLTRAGQLLRARLGRDSVLGANVLVSLANLAAAQGAHPKALALARRALAAEQRALSPDSRDVLTTRALIASELLELGDVVTAKRESADIDARLQRLGLKGGLAAANLGTWARAAAATHELAGARARVRLALEQARASAPETLRTLLTAQGRLELDHGDPRAGITALEEAIASLPDTPGAALDRAERMTWLAQAQKKAKNPRWLQTFEGLCATAAAAPMPTKRVRRAAEASLGLACPGHTLEGRTPPPP